METRTITFSWDTSALAPGYYNLTAIATSVPGEIYTIDNEKTLTVKAGRSPILKIEPSISEIQLLNKEFTINVTINNLDEVWHAVGIQFRLCYDDALLEVVDVQEGPS